MLDICPYCNSKRINKNGNKYNKQRYICRNCKKSFSDSDNRIKRDIIQKELALSLYGSNVSFKSIQRVINTLYNTNVSISLVVKWINSTAKLLEFKNRKEEKEEEITVNYNKENNINNVNNINNNNNNNNNNNKKQTINILEMDENKCIRDVSLLNITDTEVCRRNYRVII